MAWERLRQIKAHFPVLSVQPGGELRDQAVFFIMQNFYAIKKN